MAQRREVGTLWIGGPLSWLEQLCLKSFVDAGQTITLFSYEEIPNLPAGVRRRDGRDVLATSDFLKYEKKDSYALFADLFRLHMLRACPGMIWVDTDVYCHRPIDIDDDHVLGFELAGSTRVNNAVLGLPPDSPALAEMLAFTADPYAIPPWVKPALRAAYEAARAAGRPVHVSQQPWAVWGPMMLSHMVAKHGLLDRVQPVDAFYPVTFPDRLLMLKPAARVAARLTARTTALHLWASNKRELGIRHAGLPPPGSFLAALCDRHGIRPETAPIRGRGKRLFDAALVDAIDLPEVATFADLGGTAQSLALAAHARFDCDILLIDADHRGRFPAAESPWVGPYRAFLAAHAVPPEKVRVIRAAAELRPVDVLAALAGYGDTAKIRHLAPFLAACLHADSRLFLDIRKGSGAFPFLAPYGEAEVLHRREDGGVEVARVRFTPGPKAAPRPAARAGAAPPAAQPEDGAPRRAERGAEPGAERRAERRAAGGPGRGAKAAAAGLARPGGRAGGGRAWAEPGADGAEDGAADGAADGGARGGADGGANAGANGGANGGARGAPAGGTDGGMHGGTDGGTDGRAEGRPPSPAGGAARAEAVSAGAREGADPAGDWAALAAGLAGPEGFFRAGAGHSFLFVPRDPGTLVVTFDNLDLAMTKRAERRPWGYGFIEKQGWSMLGVMADGWTWYRDPWVASEFDRLAAEGFFARFRRVVFYGASMGGYAAAAFCPAAPGADVVAISPQSTLDRQLVPWETRYRTAWGRDFSGRYGDAAEAARAARRVFLFYDPYEPLDAAHAERFTGGNIVPLRAPLMGHRLGSSLHQMGILNPVILAALAGRLEPIDFWRALRARKTFPRYQRELFRRALARGRPGLAARVGRYALARGENRLIAEGMRALHAAPG